MSKKIVAISIMGIISISFPSLKLNAQSWNQAAIDYWTPERQRGTVRSGSDHINSQYAGPSEAEKAEAMKKDAEKKRKEEASDLNYQGLQAYNRQDYKMALRFFQAALNKIPNNSDYSGNLKSAQDQIAAKNKKEEDDKFLKENNEVRTRIPDDKEGKIGIPESESDDGKIGMPDPPKKTSVVPIYTYQDMNPQIVKYLKSLDNSKVPDFTWDEIVQMNIDGLKEEQEKKEFYLWGCNAVIDVFELFGKVSSGMYVSCKVALILFIKPANAAINEAEILVFKQNLMCEKTLSLLKDPVKGPQLTSIIKTLRENKPLDADVNPELIKFAYAILDPTLGNSGTKIMWSKMLSRDATHAYVNKAVNGAAELVSHGLRGKAALEAQNCFNGLNKINNQILSGEKLLNTEATEFEKPFVKFQIEKLERQMESFHGIPTGIFNVIDDALDRFHDYMLDKKK